MLIPTRLTVTLRMAQGVSLVFVDKEFYFTYTGIQYKIEGRSPGRHGSMAEPGRLPASQQLTQLSGLRNTDHN